MSAKNDKAMRPTTKDVVKERQQEAENMRAHDEEIKALNERIAANYQAPVSAESPDKEP